MYFEYLGDIEMYIEKKEEIIKLLLRLEKTIQSQEKTWYIKDIKLPSLYLWSKQVEFIGDIIAIFEGSQNYKSLEKIYEKLEIDNLYISASADYNESKRELESYIKRVKMKLLLDD